MQVAIGPSAAARHDGETGSLGFVLLPGNALTASGESIIRHLQRSILARPWSSVVLTGAHGHPAQMPQILCGFGHEDLVLTRGAADDAGSLGTVFWWQAPSGDRVRVSRPIIDLTAPPPFFSDHGPPTLRRHLRDLGLEGHALAHADQSALLLLTGEGRSDPAVIVAALRLLGLHASTLPDLADHVAALGAPRTMHVGELAGGRHQPSHRGAGSLRAAASRALRAP